jgi:hypothetical protein
MTVRRSPHSPGSLAVVLTLALAATAVAAPARVTVQAERKDAQVGQPVLVTVRVRGAEDTVTVEPPAPDGARIAPVGEPTVVPTLVGQLEASGAFHPGAAGHIAEALRGIGQMPNLGGLDPDMARLIGDPNLLKGMPAPRVSGLNTKDYVFTYLVTPERAGQLVVPAFTVSANGQAVPTAPLVLNVSAPKPQPWVRLRLSLSNPTPILGEEVQLYVDLLIRRAQVNYGGRTYPHLPVSKVTLTLPKLDGAPQFELMRPLEQFVHANAIEPGKRGFRVNNFPVEVKLEHEPADGQGADLDPALYRRRLAVPLRIREAGQATVAAAQAAGEVFVVSGGNQGQWEPFVVASEPLTFSVLDLRRRADRPAEFAGAVGPVRVTVEASRTEMPAGTPFTLTVRLQGDRSLASAGAPDLAARPEFAGSFRIRPEEARTAAGNVREFTYTLRPLSDAVKEVPPVAVSYFDPQTNSFGTARSEPIALRVTAAANATPAVPPAPQAPVPAAPPPSSAPVADEEPVAGFPFESLLPWAEGAMVLGLAAGAAVWGLRRLRRRRPVVARPVVTRTRRERTVPPKTFAGVRQTLQDFLRRHFQLPPGEVTPRDAGECLRRGGVPDGLARSFAALLETCETAEFAPGVVNTSPADLAAYARRLMDQVIAALPTPA